MKMFLRRHPGAVAALCALWMAVPWGAFGAPTWHSTVLSLSTPNMADGSRTGAASTIDPLYFYKGTDNSLWALSWNGSQWVQTPWTFDGKVADWITYHPGYNYFYFQGTDNQLWIVYRNGDLWFTVPLTTSATVAGDVAVDTVWNYIYYRGTDSRIHMVHWTGSHWMEMVLPTTPNVADSVSVDSATHYVYYRTTSGDCWVLYLSGTWQSARLSNTANVGGGIISDANIYNYYRSSVGSGWWAEFWNGSTWQQSQLDATANVGASPSASVVYSNSIVIYIDATGRAQIEYKNGSTWAHGLFGGGAVNLTGALSHAKANAMLFARRSDGNIIGFYFQ